MTIWGYGQCWPWKCPESCLWCLGSQTQTPPQKRDGSEALCDADILDQQFPEEPQVLDSNCEVGVGKQEIVLYILKLLWLPLNRCVNLKSFNICASVFLSMK